MRIKFFEQWHFKLMGQSVPVVRLDDITEDGKVKTLQLVGNVKHRANSLVNTWDEKGWEITKDAEMITTVDEKGIKALAYVVSSAGKTVNLYTVPSQYPNREDIIGHNATMDDIAEATGLNKSMRNTAIGIFIGIGIGVVFVSPVLSAMMK